MEILRIVEKLEAYARKIFAVMVDDEFVETMSEAAQLLVKQGERIADLEEQNRWIPVTERLPEPETECYVVVKLKYDFEKEYEYAVDVAERVAHGEQGYIDGMFNTWNDWNEGQEYIHITHWMPVPEPPREDS